jgi:hypothetical protein
MPIPIQQTDDGVALSYRDLRRAVGILGVALPVVVLLWGFALLGGARVLPTISDYESLRTNDAFAGILFTIAWFLFTYGGYDRRDNVAGKIACLCALGVALFHDNGPTVEQRIHYACATTLFLDFAYFSIFLFTLTGGSPTPQKLLRNRVYRGCGIGILVFIVLIAIYQWFLKGTALSAWSPVFWLESLSLWAFGIAWFVKGDTVLRDV